MTDNRPFTATTLPRRRRQCQRGFLRKVYGILTMQLSFTVQTQTAVATSVSRGVQRNFKLGGYVIARLGLDISECFRPKVRVCMEVRPKNVRMIDARSKNMNVRPRATT